MDPKHNEDNLNIITKNSLAVLEDFIYLFIFF